MKKIFILTLLCFMLFILAAIAAEDSPINWFARYEAIGDNNQNLGQAEERLELKNGWTCVVAPTTVDGSRQTNCEKGGRAIEFSVQCKESQPKDHIQVRFKDAEGKVVDFIEVGCELKQAGK